MEKKSLGELLSDAGDKSCKIKPSWALRSAESKRNLTKVARIFLTSCGKLHGTFSLGQLHSVHANLLAKRGLAELTSPAVASKAAKALRSKRTSKAGRSIAASALTQVANQRAGRK